MADGRIIGYARVSTDDRDLSLQLDALAQHGVRQDLTFTDKLSGAKSERPGLDMCLERLQPGDTLAVWRHLAGFWRVCHVRVCPSRPIN